MKTLNNLKEKFLRNSLTLLNISKNESKENIHYTKINHPLSLRKRRASAEIMAKAKKTYKYESPIFVHGDPNHYYEENTDEIPNDIKFKDINNFTLKISKNLFEKNKEVKFEECIYLNNQMEQLKKIKEELRNKEMGRIFDEYRKNKYYEKYNVDKNTLLSALIGEDHLISEMYNQNKKEKQLNEQILKNRMYKREYIKKKIIFLNKSS